MNETTKSVCPKCGAALPANAPAGLCPRCLMAMNLATQTVLPEEQAGASGAPASPPPAPAEIAPHFPQFDILECLGRGGMGVVYKARQKSLNRLVALKLLAPERVGDPQFAERFTREAQALAALNHPNIVTIHDFGQAGGFYYLLMEFVDGMNLRHLLQVERISAREALAIVPQICDALQYAHDQGIVHRDIKPENILLDRQGRVKVADFGLAKLVGTDAGGIPLTPSLSPNGGEGVSALTDAGKVMGTPQYMAPEQREHPTEVDHRADIYSLGVVFYQMLTGELPGKPIEAPSRKVHIDVRLDEVVLRALEREPERRYQQVSQVRTAVETISMDIEKSKGGSQDPASPNSTANTSSEALAQELQVSDYVLDIGSCLRRGWALVRGDFWPAVGVTTLILLLLHVGGFLFSGPLLGGLGLYFLKRIRGEQSSLETSFSGFRLAFMPLFLAGLIGVLVTSVGLVCLVLPGAFLAGVTILTLVLVIDKGLDFWPAFKLSGAAISRHWGKFFGFMLVLALINVAGIVAGVVGLLITFPISLAAAIFAYEDIFASAAWVASPQPADWKTWSSSQSQQVREICFHLTEAERREWTLRGLLFGIWNAATFFAPLGIALFASKPLNWIFAVAVLLVGLAFYPLWRRMTREFLASTSWAKQQGIAPESLWMSPHTVLVGRRGDKAVIHWRGVLLRFVMALVLLILLLVAVGAISASRSGVLAGWIDSRSMGVAFMSAAIFTWILLRHGLSTPVEQLPTLDGPGRTGPRAIESEQKRPGRKVALGLLAAAVGLGTLGAWMFLPEGTNLTGQAKIAVVAMLFTTIFGGVLAALANRGKAAPKPAGPSHLSRTAVVALVLSVGGCMLSLLIGLVIVQSWEWVYGSFFAIETAALILGILAWDRRTGKAAVILSFALMLAWIPATLTHMAQVAPDRLPKESPRIASAESPNRVLEVRCEGRKASIRAELDDLHELRLFIGSDAVGWSSWHAGWTSVTATVEASDHIKLEDGSMGRGLIFQVQGTRHNIATTPEDPVPGEVVLRPDSMITQEDGTFTFADIRKTNGTLVPVSIRVRPVSGKPPGIQSLGPVVERVVVGADQATLEGQGRPGFSLLLSLGDTTNRWECRFPYDTRFTAMFKRATRHGFSWTVSDRAGKALFATTVPQFEGEDFKQGVIVFREGTLAPEPDGSLVIAWLELGNGGLIPMSVRLEKDGKSAGMSSFSPVIERIVQEGIREKSALDLDTGEIIDGPGVLVSPKQLETWMFDSGMDLLGVVSSGAHGLTGFEMVVMPVEREHWDMPAAKVQEVLATKAPLTRAAMTRLGGLPATYLFKTRERGMGVLQIVDFTNNPSAVKIRYKLVQATGSTSAGPPQTNASRTFPLRHILASEMTDDLRQILLGKPAMEARPAPDNLQLAVTNALLRTRWSLGPTEPLVGQLNIAPEQLRQLQAISPATDIPIESVDRQELSALFNDYLSATDKPAAEKALVEAIVALDAKYSDRTMELVDTAPQVRQIFTEEQWAGPSRRFGN